MHEAARQNGMDGVTWRPRTGVRVAAVVVPWRGGTVLAGRSLRLVETREDEVLLLAAGGWLLGLLAIAATSVAAAALWPRGERV